MSEVTVEVYREAPIFVDTAQKLLPKTNEENGLFLRWIGLFLIMTYWILLQQFKNRNHLEL
ncbi:hypothetical protein RV12_GL002141 [Enterococcus quebecensis]|nr:hypothetical protein RV12_GL002141 [Enterococcus quebecensis]